MPTDFRFDADQSSLNDLVQALYSDLHRIAALRLRGERTEHTLQTTALLNEAYLKLSGAQLKQFANRNHFLVVASQIMRQVLIDYARFRSRKKRSGEAAVGSGSAADRSFEVTAKRGVEPWEILELDRALEELTQEDSSLAQLLQFRYFGGMTAQEIADAVGCSIHIVRHDLRLAQAWMRRRITRGTPNRIS
jgi:RNA polymerase sigma factor (TIGR02999 family)